VPHFLPHGQKTGPQYPNRRKILHPLPAAFSALQAENRRKRRRLSRPQTRNNLNLFSDDTCVRKNTSQPASVEFARQGGQIMRAAGCIPQNKRNRPDGTVPFILSLFYS
jgi:hypothetical protein